ncbi:SMI1/KNR4 family protein [Vitreoscilla sp. C1]|uniref:SMI1/KNR4 family protein n=1 Tax=Vitreoscilla sp. (strain C1) TaxID=96942 RepID=UPI000CDC6434|nr:SMI1/KNR4 family protein [Vitreoscilla sp. C1]AUZ04603.1 SMI1/KNR4 family protein [Vitreoscilla sp. C1]
MIQNLAQRFQAVLAKIQKQQPLSRLELNDGATEAQLVQVQADLNVVFPDDLQQWYRLFDGQSPNSEHVFNGAAWLSLSRMQALWQHMQTRVTEMSHEDIALSADDEVQALWWHDAWLPFSDDGQGNYVCVDLAPSADGVMGQIIRVRFDNMVRSLEATSLEAWLDAHIEALEESDYVYSAKHGGIMDAEILFEEEDEGAADLPSMSPEAWQDMEGDLQNTLTHLLGEGAPDLKQLVNGLLDEDSPFKNQAESAAHSKHASFKDLFDSDVKQP